MRWRVMREALDHRSGGGVHDVSWGREARVSNVQPSDVLVWRYVDAGEPLSIEPTQSRSARGGPCSAHYAGRTERSGDLVTSSR